MTEDNHQRHHKDPSPQGAVTEQLRADLREGHDWFVSLLKAMAAWSVPEEFHKGRSYKYFIGGEAFDWLLLAERLYYAANELLPAREMEDLLFTGRLPHGFDPARLKELLGVDKYRGFLNFFYGVTVEEALQLAVEYEVLKKHTSNGMRYKEDVSEEACLAIYQSTKTELLAKFRAEMSLKPGRHMGLTETKEFTYWLFKYRLKTSDPAKIASDTKKGIDQLTRMKAAANRSTGSSTPESPEILLDLSDTNKPD